MNGLNHEVLGQINVQHRRSMLFQSKKKPKNEINLIEIHPLIKFGIVNHILT